MFRLLLLMALTLPRLALAAPPRKVEPFMLHLKLKTGDGRALQHGHKAGIELKTGPLTTITVKDWNGVELVSGDVISFSSHDQTVQATRVAGSNGLAWQPTTAELPTRFVIRKVDGANGSPILSGDRVRFQLFGEKDTYLGGNAQLVQAPTPGPEQTWLVRRETYGNQAARKLEWDAAMASTPEKRRELYEVAFARGAVDTMNKLGDMYLDGRFGSVDLPAAAVCYRRGAEAGDPASMFMYGVMLYHGRGVAENKAEAVRWEQTAALADYTNASDQLKQWGVAVPGVTVVAAPAAPPAATVIPFRYSVGALLLSKGSPAFFIVGANQGRYRVLTRQYYEPGDYFWTGNEYGRYQVSESWMKQETLEGYNLEVADKLYRTCNACDGEGCVMEQMTSRRGGYNYVKDGAVYHVSEYDKPTYKRQQRCPGCSGQGWIPKP